MIVVAPLHALDEAIARWSPSHIISLTSPDAPAPALPAEVECLRLRFHDIVEPRPGLSPASEEHIDRMLRFAAAWSSERPLLIHCWAGISRSPAAAYVIACSRNRSGLEQALALDLRGVAPFATPNARMVAIADHRLTRGGRMSRAIESIGRGADASSGEIFSLKTPVRAPSA